MTESQAQKRAEELERTIDLHFLKAGPSAIYKAGYMAAYHDSQKVIEKLVEALEEIAETTESVKDFRTGYWEHEQTEAAEIAFKALKQWKEGGK